MTGALLFLLAQTASVDALVQDPAMLEFYYCASERADLLAMQSRAADRRPAGQIADEALQACREFRAAALAVALPAALNDPEIAECVRTGKLTDEAARNLVEQSFDESIRRQLTINVAASRGEAFREQDAEDR